MKTLFIDSSRKSLSVALANSNELLFVSNVNSYSKHSNYLMKEIINILNKANLSINDVDSVVVLNGPGSFTGVRVGVTIAKTISWVLSKSIYQLTTLKALRANVDDEIVICVVYDKDAASYVGIYSDSKNYEDYLSLGDERLRIKNKKITIVCMEDNPYINHLKELLSAYNEVKIKIIDDYDYLKVIKFALNTSPINPHLAEPIYLKKIDAEKTKNDG